MSKMGKMMLEILMSRLRTDIRVASSRAWAKSPSLCIFTKKMIYIYCFSLALLAARVSLLLIFPAIVDLMF
jgi:hypothetical protein